MTEADAREGDARPDTRARTRRAVGLDRDQARALGRALGNGHGHANGRGKKGRLVRFPKKLATAQAFAFGYAPGLGVVADERPAGGGRLLAVRDEIVPIDGDSYGWVGQVYVADDPTDPVGTISLVYHREIGVMGEIQVRADSYRIEPLGEKLHVLINVDEASFPEATGDPQADGSGAHQSVRQPAAVRPTQPALGPTLTAEVSALVEAPVAVAAGSRASNTARVLVLYTADAVAAVPNIEALISEAIVYSNTAYARSVTPARLELAHKQLLVGFDETGDIFKDSQNKLPSNPTAQALRDTYQADLVVLLTRPGAYGSTYGRANGIFTLGVTTSETAYAIVDAAEAVSNRVFTHEVGHLQGARHHPDDDRPPTPGVTDPGFAYGRGHREVWSKCFNGIGWLCGYNRFATIMAYPKANGDTYGQIQNFSSNIVQVDGRPTGFADRNNALVLTNTAAAVSAFRANPLSASIGGPNVLLLFETGTWTAGTDGGSGATSYKWFKDGVFTGVTTSSYTTEAGYSDFSLRVEVTRGSDMASGSKYVTVDDSECAPGTILCPGYGFLTAGPEGETAPDAFALRSVGSNPAQGSAALAFDVPQAAAVRVTVYDVLGREVARLADGQTRAGTHRVSLDVSGLAPGLYVVRMETDAFSATQEITVVR